MRLKMAEDLDQITADELIEDDFSEDLGFLDD